jgi:hypothetical protein
MTQRAWFAVVAVVVALAGTSTVVLGAGSPTFGTYEPAAVSNRSSARPDPEPVPEPNPPPEPTETYTVWHWNVAGSTLHGGSVSDGMVEAVVASVLAQGAHLVSLNELCRPQFDAVLARLTAARWPQDPTRFAAFQASIEGQPGVCAGEPYGVALFSATPIAESERTVLPRDEDGGYRVLLCSVVGPRAAVRFCTTHITTSSFPAADSAVPLNFLQLNAVLGRLEVYATAGESVLIAGDLNAQPHYGRLDAWYASSVDGPVNGGNTGPYRELDDTDSRCPGYGEATALGSVGVAAPCGAGVKVDHVFARADQVVGPYRADALEIPYRCAGVPELRGVRPAGACSDHQVLVGRVTVRVHR